MYSSYFSWRLNNIQSCNDWCWMYVFVDFVVHCSKRLYAVFVSDFNPVLLTSNVFDSR
jgi:hypothetical protein